MTRKRTIGSRRDDFQSKQSPFWTKNTTIKINFKWESIILNRKITIWSCQDDFKRRVIDFEEKAYLHRKRTIWSRQDDFKSIKIELEWQKLICTGIGRFKAERTTFKVRQSILQKKRLLSAEKGRFEVERTVFNIKVSILNEKELL